MPNFNPNIIHYDGVQDGSVISLVYHKLYRGNRFWISIDTEFVVQPWTQIDPDDILNQIKYDIETKNSFDLHVDATEYDKFTTYNGVELGSGNLLILIDAGKTVSEDMIADVQTIVKNMKLSTQNASIYVESFGSDFIVDGMEEVLLPTLNSIIIACHGDRTPLFANASYREASTNLISTLKNIGLKNNSHLPDIIQLFSVGRTKDSLDNTVILDDFSIEILTKDVQFEVENPDESINNLTHAVKNTKISNFTTIWVKTTSSKHLI